MQIDNYNCQCLVITSEEHQTLIASLNGRTNVATDSRTNMRRDHFPPNQIISFISTEIITCTVSYNSQSCKDAMI